MKNFKKSAWDEVLGNLKSCFSIVITSKEVRMMAPLREEAANLSEVSQRPSSIVIVK
jgi:hypothetical protein